MKLSYLFASAVLACGAFASAEAVAQNDQHHDQHQEEHRGAPQGSQQHGGAPQGGHGQQGGQMHGPQGGQMHGPQGHPGGTMGGPSHGNMMMHGQMNGPANGGHHKAMMGHDRPAANFDRHAYQRNFVAPRHYHSGVYVRPHGWYEHRWAYGEILPALFWTQNYWLTDYNDYGLADPPPGFIWVRYGDDALLVDQNSGEVLQVEYSVFD